MLHFISDHTINSFFILLPFSIRLEISLNILSTCMYVFMYVYITHLLLVGNQLSIFETSLNKFIDFFLFLIALFPLTPMQSSYREADLRLCFRICKKPVFSRLGSIEVYLDSIPSLTSNTI